MKTRISEFVQPTGKMKNRKNWTFATLWLMEKVDVWWNGGSSHFFSRIGSDGSQSYWLRGEQFSRGVHSAIGKMQRLTQKNARKRASTQHCSS
jgi:hypothetical protein